MHLVRPIFQSPSFALLRFQHSPNHDDCADGDEICSAYAVNFVEAGGFELGINNQRWELSSGAVFLSEPGVIHRYRHFSRRPSDICLSARYSPGFFEAEQRAEPDFFKTAPPIVATTNRLAFLRYELNRLLNSPNDVAVETWACELFMVTRTPPSFRSLLYRPRQLASYADRVMAARDRLAREYSEPHSLVSLARAAGMSVFHFARIFNQLIGTPPHRYLVLCRLDQALKMLRAGRSVTESCFDSGFTNLSHFIRSFQRRFGCRPSLVSRELTRMSKKR
jgi:AraC-like DNA-binding protein